MVLTVPSAAVPPVVPLTDQVTAPFVVPETVTLNANESPARIFAVAGDTVTVIEGGGGGGDLVPRLVAEQPAEMSAARSEPNWNSLRISEDTHRVPAQKLNIVWGMGGAGDTGRKGRSGPMSTA